MFLILYIYNCNIIECIFLCNVLFNIIVLLKNIAPSPSLSPSLPSPSLSPPSPSLPLPSQNLMIVEVFLEYK